MTKNSTASTKSKTEGAGVRFMVLFEPCPQSTSPRRGQTFVWVIIVLLLAVFCGLAVYRIRSGDFVEVNEEKLRELTSATFKENQSPDVADWPQWRGPNRDGVSAETGLLPTWPTTGPRLLWTQPAGEGFASVVVAQGRAFTLVQDGPDEAVVCWDAATGREKWRHAYPARFENPYGNGPRSTPSIAGTLLYTVGATGVMHCLKAFTDQPQGEVVWRKDLLTEFGAKNLPWGVSFSPLVAGKLVIVMPGGSGGNALAALDKETGTIVWKNLDDSPSYSSPVPATFDGRPQIVCLTGERLVGIEPEAGQLLWEVPWAPGAAHEPTNIATPLVIGDYVFLSSGYNKGCTLLKIEAGAKAVPIFKNRSLRTVISSAVRQGDYLYGFDESNLACVELRTGKVKWKERGFDKGSLLLADGKFIVLGERGKLALVAATPDEYRELAAFEHSEQPSSWSVPTLAQGRLYVRDKTRVVCYDLKKRD